MLEKIKSSKEKFIAEIKASKTAEEVENIRIKYLSKKGEITALFGGLKDLVLEVKKEAGNLLNTFRDEAYEMLNARKESFETDSTPQLDLSLPGRKNSVGKLHPLLVVRDEMKTILMRMGFSLVVGPEVEDEYHIFDALNMPEWHPARRITDSLYVDGSRLLRTETSSVQIRTMEKFKPPFRIIAPGRVYRNEKEDATHTAMFSQCEGLYVDKNVSFAELKGTLLEFFKVMYGADTKIRFRPHFFPFTEPSAECDISCYKCGGKGCSLCKGSGWIELCGCGMVNPKVLEGLGIDSEVYSGFAFGIGIERVAMMKYQTGDIRDFYENDLRFLEQF